MNIAFSGHSAPAASDYIETCRMVGNFDTVSSVSSSGSIQELPGSRELLGPTTTIHVALRYTSTVVMPLVLHWKR